MWDYVLSGSDKPSWFFFDTMGAVAYFHDDVRRGYHVDDLGHVTRFERTFLDYGQPIEKLYQFPIQHFERYDLLKDILYILITARSDTDSKMEITYQCDYGDWVEPMPILAYSWELAPRNLAYRFLGVLRYAAVAKRKPGLRHIRHFGMRMTNNIARNDMAIVSAQIYYRYSAGER